jgi:subtilase family serine protease
MKGVVLALLLSVAPAQSKTVVISLRHDPLKIEALADLLDYIADPKSVQYGNWLSSETLESFVKAPQSLVKDVKTWLNKEHNICKSNSNSINKNLEIRITGQGDFLEVDNLSDACIGHLQSKHKNINDLSEGIFIKDQSSPASSSLNHHQVKFAKDGLDSVGSPPQQKEAYGIPSDVSGASDSNLQMVWGPGTFGYLESDLEEFYSEFDVANADISTVSTYGYPGEVGGDNFYEGTLDVTYISSMGAGADTVVANTNQSESTEETTGFGYALQSFSYMLATAGLGLNGSLPQLPRVVSMSLGSLSYDSCVLLCDELVAEGDYTQQDCDDYMATQRQVCMYASGDIVDRINVEFMKATARGVTLLGATGDGGSHFSFGAFPDDDGIGTQLNGISCANALPTFPAESPYVVGVGGEQWDDGGTSAEPVYWYSGGAGFSRRFSQPQYQADAVNQYLATADLPPLSSFNQTMRAYPDVVALAWGVPMIADGSLMVTGGTSASAPAFAGIVSLLNAMRLSSSLPPLGFLQPRLYQSAAQISGLIKMNPSASSLLLEDDDTPMFFDILVGNSSQGGDRYTCSSGFVAQEGWDAATGWGSPRWDGLVKYLASDDFLPFKKK